jgi:hypothetical protein
MSLFDDASLIVTPNGVKEGKLYSIKPSDGSGDLSVTRATTATRVNSAGLVELVPYNLCTYSEELNIWTTSRASVTTNATTAPNGTTTADKVITDSTANTTHQIYIGPFPVPNLPLVISVYAKKSEYDYIHLGKDTATTKTWFDLTNGTVGTQGSDVLSASIESVGNGWYRCINVINNTSTSSYVELGPASQDGTRVISGTPSGGIFAWGAQLVEGSVAKDYLRTETRLNIPRLDYTNGSCPSILVEPQRTNLFTYSSSFDNSAWEKANATITANSVASPSGIQDADTLTTTSTTLENYTRFSTFSILGNVGSSYTTSVYAKKGSGTFLRIRNLFVNNGADDGNAWFNLNTGAVGTVESSQTASIQDMGNGWYRCSLTGVVGSVGALNLIDIGFTNTDATNFPSSNVNGYIWGAQLEAGSYATSYIPTTSASVTRNADVISKTGISSLIGQTEGTFFVEFNYNGIIDNTTSRKIISLNDGSSANLIDAYIQQGETTLLARLRNGAVGIGSISSSALSSGNYKIAYAYKNSDFVLYINGTQIGSVSSGAISFTSPVQIVQIGDGESTSDQLGGLIKSATIWKTRLTNAELATLTTI